MGKHARNRHGYLGYLWVFYPKYLPGVGRRGEQARHRAATAQAQEAAADR